MKKALITGGTSGVGLSIAEGVLAQGYSVALIGRDQKRGADVIQELEALYPGRVTFFSVDLSDQNIVQSFIEAYTAGNDTLDLLANCAGIVSPKRVVTHQNCEQTFAVGFLSAAQLSVALMPLLQNASHGRIINVSGGASMVLTERLKFTDLTFKKGYNGFKAAITAVHAKTVLTEVLAERYSDVSVVSFHPGIVRSNLQRNLRGILGVVARFTARFFPVVCTTGIFVATDPLFIKESGVYVVKKRVKKLHFTSPYKKELWNVVQSMFIVGH
ncbi:MAG: SDR family NAD(P)-dependent oxidoreductase [Fibrobacterales bacterium]